MLNPPTVFVPVVAVLLSLGYDMTQPLFGGIITALGGKRAGQAMGLNVFTLFVGFGIGSLGFGAMIGFGFVAAFSLFAGMELILGVLSFALFRTELPSCAPRVLPDGSRRGVPFEQSLVGSNLLTHSLRWFLR